jgi:hypothetical protein
VYSVDFNKEPTRRLAAGDDGWVEVAVSGRGLATVEAAPA